MPQNNDTVQGHGIGESEGILYLPKKRYRRLLVPLLTEQLTIPANCNLQQTNRAKTTAMMMMCCSTWMSLWLLLLPTMIDAFCIKHDWMLRATATRGATTTTTTLMMVQRDPIRMPSQTPMVPYKAPNSDYAQFVSIEAAMYRDRTMMINRYIDEQAANNIISIMLYLRNESPRDKISLYFNVPGGQLRPSLAIYDLIQNTKKTCEIETVNLALCAGMGAILCSAGTKGKRSAMPNSRFLLQRTGMDNVFQGQATDIALEVKNVKTWNDRMETELAQLTGQKMETISQDLQRDFYLSADEAVQYGLIDRVLLPSPRKRAARGGEANLGAFDQDNAQRYQTSQAGGGWGSQQDAASSQSPPPKTKKRDDDEPKTAF